MNKSESAIRHEANNLLQHLESIEDKMKNTKTIIRGDHDFQEEHLLRLHQELSFLQLEITKYLKRE